MTEKLTDEQLRGYAANFSSLNVRAMATELLALRAERAKQYDEVEAKRIDESLSDAFDDLSKFETRADAVRELIRMTNDAQDIAMRLKNREAERAKPTQSDDMSKDHVDQAKEIASRFRSADRAGYKGWGVIYQALASIRAEGSAERAKDGNWGALAEARAINAELRAERAKLGAALNLAMPFVVHYSDDPLKKATVNRIRQLMGDPLAQPAESGATE